MGCQSIAIPYFWLSNPLNEIPNKIDNIALGQVLQVVRDVINAKEE